MPYMDKFPKRLKEWIIETGKRKSLRIGLYQDKKTGQILVDVRKHFESDEWAAYLKNGVRISLGFADELIKLLQEAVVEGKKIEADVKPEFYGKGDKK